MYSLQDSIPATATAHTPSHRGYRNITCCLARSPSRWFATPDTRGHKFLGGRFQSRAAPVEAQTQNCNACHYSLSRTRIRNEVQYCILCHNPNATDASVRPAAQMPAQTIAFRS